MKRLVLQTSPAESRAGSSQSHEHEEMAYFRCCGATTGSNAARIRQLSSLEQNSWGSLPTMCSEHFYRRAILHYAAMKAEKKRVLGVCCPPAAPSREKNARLTADCPAPQSRNAQCILAVADVAARPPRTKAQPDHESR